MDEVSDIADELYETVDRAGLPDAFRQRVDALDPGEEGRAELLSYLAEQLEVEGRLDEAEAAYREAAEDGGPTLLHPLGGLLSVAVARGDDEAVAAANRQLWTLARADRLAESDFEMAGESLELHGDLRGAMRWFTVLLSEYDPDEIELLPVVACYGRSRVRRLLDLPHDRYDDAVDLVQAYHSERLSD